MQRAQTSILGMAGNSGEKYEKKWVSPNPPYSPVMPAAGTSGLYFKIEAQTLPWVQRFLHHTLLGQ